MLHKSTNFTTSPTNLSPFFLSNHPIILSFLFWLWKDTYLFIIKSQYIRWIKIACGKDENIKVAHMLYDVTIMVISNFLKTSHINNVTSDIEYFCLSYQSKVIINWNNVCVRHWQGNIYCLNIQCEVQSK